MYTSVFNFFHENKKPVFVGVFCVAVFMVFVVFVVFIVFRLCIQSKLLKRIEETKCVCMVFIDAVGVNVPLAVVIGVHVKLSEVT